MTLITDSCITQKRCNEKFPPQSYDSLSYHTAYVETIRDTTVILSDSSYIIALLQCDSAGNVSLKQLEDYKSGKYLKPPGLSINDNKLMAKVNLDSMAVQFWLKDRHYAESVSAAKREVVTIRENYLTSWQSFQMWVGRILGGLILIALIVKFVKWKLK